MVERLVTSAVAALLRRYPTSAITSRTLARVAALTDGESVMTRDTVWHDMPAIRATSLMLGFRRTAGPLGRTRTVPGRLQTPLTPAPVIAASDPQPA